MIMTKKLILSSSPHIHSGRSTSAIMRDVLIALLPAAMAGTVIFGLRSLAVIAACCIAISPKFKGSPSTLNERS